MAKATTPRTTTIQAAPDLAAGLAAGTVTIEAIDPQTAQLDPNIRTNPVLPEGFVDSIRTEGVREPVLARRGEDGTVFVYDGQRRLLAAREAALPVLLAVFGVADTTGSASGRIMDQLRTFARADLALTDRLAAYEQLALEGISVEKIAKSAGAGRDEVQDALTVARSQAARQAVEWGQESLERLLLIAEFEGDDDAAAQINDCDDDDLNYVAQELRNEKAIAERNATEKAAYIAGGGVVIENGDEYTRLHSLTDAADDAATRPAVDPVAHTACAGHAVLFRVYGLRDGDVDMTAVCTKPELHQPRWNYATHSTTPVEAAEPTEAEVEAEAEVKRVARRRLIANNKAWDAAETVRGEWLKSLLSRKKLPTGVAQFVAVTLTRHRYDLNNDANSTNGQLLGIDGYNARELMAAQAEATPARAAYVSLAVALSARESATSRESWRHPQADACEYLTQLETWGYHLSDVERIAAGYPEPAPADADAEAFEAETV